MKTIGILNKIMKIKWKYSSRMNCHEGYLNGELIFCIEGTLCVTDIRPEFERPSYYKIISVDDGKEIAFDLLNNINVEKHQKNKDAWIAEQQKTSDLISKVDELLKSLKDK